MNLEQQLNARWYGRPGILWLLLPLEGLFRAVAALRRRLIEPQRLPVPVIVVGNLAVGGSGKTPMVLALVEHLRQRGYRPGVVSRGYGGHSDEYPLRVTAENSAEQVGDEPLLLAELCPVAVSPDRYRAATYLLQETDCNLLFSDDGLQHYRLPRDIEVVVVDGERGFGNRLCLPAGPLREPLSRLEQVDFVLVNETVAALDLPGAGACLGPLSVSEESSGGERGLSAIPTGAVKCVSRAWLLQTGAPRRVPPARCGRPWRGIAIWRRRRGAHRAHGSH